MEWWKVKNDELLINELINRLNEQKGSRYITKYSVSHLQPTSKHCSRACAVPGEDLSITKQRSFLLCGGVRLESV